MLTQSQLNKLARDFQIDSFTFFREYLQLLFLNYFYQEKQTEIVYFKGGTCLRLLYNSPRFSEDLDFSTTLSPKTIKSLLEAVITRMQKEIPQIKLTFLWQGRQALRYQFKYQGKEFKYALTIRLDFALEKILMHREVSQIKTKIPINFLPLILHLKQEEILTEKIRAFLTRAKGRDIFDLWYLLDNGVVLDKKILAKKLKKVKRTFNKESFLEKIKNYPSKKLHQDLAKFLPQNFRKIIPLLKEKILAVE